MKRRFVLLMITACVVAQAVVFMALSEPSGRTEYDFHITLLENEQAASVLQKVSYTNRTGETLSRVMFSVYANVFRREASLPYDNASLEEAFPWGYAPGGLDIHYVSVNGEAAEWGIQGENEAFLRVSCALAPGETCEFAFSYTLLLTENRAFLGSGGTDWRFTAFYPSVCPYEEGDFVTNPVTYAGEFLYSEAADFSAEILVPADYEVACGGISESLGATEDGAYRIFRTELTGARELAFSASRKFHSVNRKASDGTQISVYGQNRRVLRKAAQHALEALEYLNAHIGAYPYPKLSIVFSDLQDDQLSASGIAFVSSRNTEELAHTVHALVCRQYFGEVVQPNPAREAWMIEGVSEYAALLMTEDMSGDRAFSDALNRRVFPSLQITVPGGLLPHMETKYFSSQSEYETVVAERGCAALHEIRIAMGRDAFMEFLREYFYACAFECPDAEKLISIMNRVSGGEWRGAVYGWLNTIGDYMGEFMDEYD